MKKDAKFRMIGIVLIVIALVLLLIGGFGNRAIKSAVEKAASEALGVEVSIGDISLSIFGGSVELEDLVVANPEGYSGESFLSLGNAKIDVSIKSLLSDTVEIEDMRFSDVSISVEQKGLTNNLQTILDSLPAKDQSADTGDAKDLRVTYLELKNIRVEVQLLPLPGQISTVPLTIESIEMHDLGTDNKLSIAKLTGKILMEIAAGIAREGADLLPLDMIGPLSSVLKEKGGMVIEAGMELLDKGKDIGEGVIDVFKNLLKKDEE